MKLTDKPNKLKLTPMGSAVPLPMYLTLVEKRYKSFKVYLSAYEVTTVQEQR